MFQISIFKKGRFSRRHFFSEGSKMVRSTPFFLKNGAGFTFIDVVVGISLVLIIFLGILNAYQLAIGVVTKSGAKITATSLANQKLEEARNLPYQKIGIEGVDENGALKMTEYYPSDTEKYTIITDVSCVLDDTDGLIPIDLCPCDYKNVIVTVSWSGRFGGDVSLATDISPKNDIQECETQGGVLRVNVFNSQGIGVTNIEVEVEEVATGNKKYCLTDYDGKCTGENGIFLDTSLEAENYKITIPRSGSSSEYSTNQTFKSGDSYGSKIIANPMKPNATILEGQVTEMSFSIDILGTFSIETKSSRGKRSFNDKFDNMSKISVYSDIIVSGGEAALAKTGGDYISPGFLISTHITSPNLQGWNQLSWIESKPANTEIVYQLLYFDSDDWVLISDADLPGNSIGLGPSPVDLSVLDYSFYDGIRIKATLSTVDISQTPLLYEWNLTYFTRVARPISGVTFYLRGKKIVGTDVDENSIYKYPLIQHSINKSGYISDLEWDTYIFSDFAISGENVELEESVPGQILPDGNLSINLSPNTTQPLILYLAAENTFLIKVEDLETSDPIFSANVRLYNLSLGYDKTQQTDENGGVFFVPLAEDFYSLEITAEGYQTYTEENVWISEDTSVTINLVLFPS